MEKNEMRSKSDSRRRRGGRTAFRLLLATGLALHSTASCLVVAQEPAPTLQAFPQLPLEYPFAKKPDNVPKVRLIRFLGIGANVASHTSSAGPNAQLQTTSDKPALPTPDLAVPVVSAAAIEPATEIQLIETTSNSPVAFAVNTTESLIDIEVPLPASALPKQTLESKLPASHSVSMSLTDDTIDAGELSMSAAPPLLPSTSLSRAPEIVKSGERLSVKPVNGSPVRLTSAPGINLQVDPTPTPTNRYVVSPLDKSTQILLNAEPAAPTVSSQPQPQPVANKPQRITPRDAAPKLAAQPVGQAERAVTKSEHKQPIAPTNLVAPSPMGIASRPQNLHTSKTSTNETHISSSPSKTPNLNFGEPIDVNSDAPVSLEFANQITSTSVENPDIARLFTAGDGRLTLIGLRTGQTRVAVVQRDASGVEATEVRVVTVQLDSRQTQSLADSAESLNDLIAELYPTCVVSVSSTEDSLVVSGETDSESTAKKILNLVRKSSLVPVVDQLRSLSK